MTYAQRILDLLWVIAPEGATNGEIAHRLGISSHQTVYLLTQDLARRGFIRGEQSGRTWVFSANEEVAGYLALPTTPATVITSLSTLTPAKFEALARRTLSDRYGIPLSPGVIQGVPKRFDFVSPDRQIVGDAKYYTLVGGTGLPPAKFSIIAEHVWLLEKTGAPTTFLVFGNDRSVPTLWLERYGDLVSSVTFYFLTDAGHLAELAKSNFK